MLAVVVVLVAIWFVLPENGIFLNFSKEEVGFNVFVSLKRAPDCIFLVLVASIKLLKDRLCSLLSKPGVCKYLLSMYEVCMWLLRSMSVSCCCTELSYCCTPARRQRRSSAQVSEVHCTESSPPNTTAHMLLLLLVLGVCANAAVLHAGSVVLELGRVCTGAHPATTAAV